MDRIAFVLLAFVTFIFSSYKNAEVTSKHTLIVFEGSDWCAYCNKFNKNVMNDIAFQKYLKDKNIELLKVDFPQRKKQTKELIEHNGQIAEQYNFKGIFPTIIIASKDSHKTLSYKSDVDVKNFINQIDDFIQ